MLVSDNPRQSVPGPQRFAGWRLIVALSTVVALLAIANSALVIRDARARTPQIVSSLLASQQMQVRIGDLPADRVKLLLAVQDPRFYEHGGVDYSGGRSTVTQALVKTLYFESYERSIANKFKQNLIAEFALDSLATKDEQLQIFINTVYLGSVDERTVHGFEQAAGVYFGKRLGELSAREYLSILAMLDAPTAFNVATQPQANAVRVAQLQAKLEKRY